MPLTHTPCSPLRSAWSARRHPGHLPSPALPSFTHHSKGARVDTGRAQVSGSTMSVGLRGCPRDLQGELACALGRHTHTQDPRKSRLIKLPIGGQLSSPRQPAHRLCRSIRLTSIAHTSGRPLPAPLPDRRRIGTATRRRTLIVFVRCHDLNPPQLRRRPMQRWERHLTKHGGSIGWIRASNRSLNQRSGQSIRLTKSRIRL